MSTAWAAGLFDGEGCTSLAQEKWLRINITQQHPEVLEKFRASVGLGQVYGPTNNRGKDMWQYAAAGKAAVVVLGLLWPHLGSVKRDQALTKLEAMKGV